jgi:hypothetical protein
MPSAAVPPHVNPGPGFVPWLWPPSHANLSTRPSPRRQPALLTPKPWEEGKTALPPWPKDGDLVEFNLDTASPSRFRYFIDGKHLSIGSDEEVVRYTLVAESPSGTRNVTFEGLRCKAQGVFRTYAYGSNDRFILVEGADWQAITSQSGDRLHRELHGHFLCAPRTFEPRPIPDMIRALQGKVRGRENTGFLPD